MKRSLVLFVGLVLASIASKALYAQTRPQEPLLTATLAEGDKEKLTLMAKSTATFWIDWGDGIPTAYSKGTYGESNPLVNDAKGSYIKLYGEEITALALNKCSIKEVSVGFGNVPLSLSLDENPLHKADFSRSHLLKTLSIRGGNLASLDLAGKEKLTTLVVSDNQLKEINLDGCKALQELDLSDNMLPGVFDVPRSVSLLTLSDNLLQEVRINDENSLQDATLRNNHLQSVSIPASESLRSLDLFGNLLEELHIATGLPSLVNLQLSNNRLQEIDLANCPELRGLSIAFNALEEIDLSANKKLSALLLSNNQLAHITLPKEAPLQIFEAEYNDLCELDLSPFHDLEEIRLSNNKIEKVTLSSSPSSLVCLLLASNQLDKAALDAIIDRLPDVTELYVPTYQEDWKKNFTLVGNKSPREAKLSDALAKGWILDVSPSEDPNQKVRFTLEEVASVLSFSASTISGKLVARIGQETHELVVGTSLCRPLPNTLRGIKAGQAVELVGEILFLDLSNAKSINSLDCTNAPSLQVLNCSGNRLQELDLSHCTKLEALYCHENELQTLSSLTNCPALRELIAYRNNLEQSDFANNTQLRVLNIDFNRVANPKLEKLINLQKLSCKKNGIKGILDLSNNTKLEALSCETNKIEQLNLSQNRKLETLYCGDNKLATLSLAPLNRIVELNCKLNNLTSLDVAGLPLLRELYCFDNQLSSLDLSHNPHLRTLSAGANQLTTIKLEGCDKLTSLALSYNQLATIDLSLCSQLAATLLDHNLLTQLTLNSQELRIVAIHNNALSETESIRIVEQLPSIPQDQEQGILIFFNKEEFPEDEEKNLLAPTAIEKAKTKNWLITDGETILSHSQPLARDLLVYPTVAESTLHIEGHYHSYLLVDTMGNVVKKSESEQHTIDLSHLPLSKYLLILYKGKDKLVVPIIKI